MSATASSPWRKTKRCSRSCFTIASRPAKDWKDTASATCFCRRLAEVTGDFSKAVELSAAILATRGNIYPATTSNAQLYAVMDDGSFVRGETNITASDRRIVELRMAPANAKPLPVTLEAIESADLITVGPGSLFTSLVPNLLVRDVSKAIQASRATKVFVCNLMTQANESLGLTASDHIRALYKHARHEFFEYALVNSTPASAPLMQKYAETASVSDRGRSGADRGAGREANPGRLPDGRDAAADGLIARHNTRNVAHDLLRLMMEVRETPVVAEGAQLSSPATCISVIF